MTEEEKDAYIKKLLTSNIDQHNKISFLSEKVQVLQKQNGELTDKVRELEAQIEKMKCCANCRHSRTEYEHCRTDKHEKWEIKEND